jgi:hypothetical protein
MEIEIKHLGENFTIKKDDVNDISQLYEVFDKIALFMGYDNQEIDNHHKSKQNNSLNFEKVIKFQDIFSVNADSLNMEESDLRVSLIHEELEELKESFKNEDVVEVLDAYMDIIFLALGGLIRHGYKDIVNDAFNEVCNSNLSKYDENYEDACLTEQLYKIKQVETYKEYSEIYDVFLTKRKEDGKVLKSHKYQEPKLKQFLNI